MMVTTNGTTAHEPQEVETKALVVANDLAFQRELEPRSLDALFNVAARLAKIQLCGTTSAEDAMTRMLTGRELGLTMMQSMRGVHVIEGRPALDASLMQALVEQSAECEHFRCTHTDENRATYVTKRRGNPEQEYTFTIDDARRAGLLDRGKDPSKNNWNKYPKDMLRARAKSGLARMVYPDKLFGLYAREEMLDGAAPQIIAERPAEVIVQTPARDLEAEFQSVADAITYSTSKDELTAARKASIAFGNDAGEPYKSRLAEHYNAFVAAKRKAATEAPKAQEAPPVPPSEPRMREPGED